MNIGEQIKKKRKDCHISQRDLAAKLDMPYSTLANYENGHRTPSIETIEKISNALNISIAELMGLDTSFAYNPEIAKLAHKTKSYYEYVSGESDEPYVERYDYKQLIEDFLSFDNISTNYKLNSLPFELQLGIYGMLDSFLSDLIDIFTISSEEDFPKFIDYLFLQTCLLRSFRHFTNVNINLPEFPESKFQCDKETVLKSFLLFIDEVKTLLDKTLSISTHEYKGFPLFAKEIIKNYKRNYSNNEEGE